MQVKHTLTDILTFLIFISYYCAPVVWQVNLFSCEILEVCTSLVVIISMQILHANFVF